MIVTELGNLIFFSTDDYWHINYTLGEVTCLEVADQKKSYHMFFCDYILFVKERSIDFVQ